MVHEAPLRARSAETASPDEGAFGVIARGLSKRFGSVVAVHNATFSLPSQGVCGLLGPNGAGKTTTIRMLAGVLTPDAGSLSLAGVDALREGGRVRKSIGYLPESAPLYPELTVREYLAFRAGIAGLDRRAARDSMDEAMHRTDVARFCDRCCGALSKGMQQRVGLAATLLGQPAVLILDEPSVGLDPGQTLAFRELIRALGETRLVLLSSHLLAEVEDVCSELLIIARGRVVAHESMEVFRRRARAGTHHRIESERSFLSLPEFRGLCDEATERPLPDGWVETRFTSSDPRARELVGRALLGASIPARVLEGTDTRLEQVFVALVERARRENEPRRDNEPRRENEVSATEVVR